MLRGLTGAGRWSYQVVIRRRCHRLPEPRNQAANRAPMDGRPRSHLSCLGRAFSSLMLCRLNRTQSTATHLDTHYPKRSSTILNNSIVSRAFTGQMNQDNVSRPPISYRPMHAHCINAGDKTTYSSRGRTLLFFWMWLNQLYEPLLPAEPL